MTSILSLFRGRLVRRNRKRNHGTQHHSRTYASSANFAYTLPTEPTTASLMRGSALAALMGMDSIPIVPTTRSSKPISDEAVYSPKTRSKMVRVSGPIHTMPDIHLEDHEQYFFVEPAPMNDQLLLPLIQQGEFFSLIAPPFYGKTTTILRAQQQFNNHYTCLTLTMQMVNCENTQPADFWRSLTQALIFHNRQYSELKECSSGVEFASLFQNSESFNNKKVVLFIDDFDLLLHPKCQESYKAFMRTFKALKESSHLLNLQSVILVSCQKISAGAPFAVTVEQPAWTFDQVSTLVQHFGYHRDIIIRKKVAQDIYLRTKGHPGCVALCLTVLDEVVKQADSVVDDIYQKWIEYLSTSNSLHIFLQSPLFLKLREQLEDNPKLQQLVLDNVSELHSFTVTKQQLPFALELVSLGIFKRVPPLDTLSFEISCSMIRDALSHLTDIELHRDVAITEHDDMPPNWITESLYSPQEAALNNHEPYGLNIKSLIEKAFPLLTLGQFNRSIMTEEKYQYSLVSEWWKSLHRDFSTVGFMRIVSLELPKKSLTLSDKPAEELAHMKIVIPPLSSQNNESSSLDKTPPRTHFGALVLEHRATQNASMKRYMIEFGSEYFHQGLSTLGKLLQDSFEVWRVVVPINGKEILVNQVR